MLNISNPKKLGNTQLVVPFYHFKHPLFDLLFRSYFLLGVLVSCITLVVWLMHLNNFLIINSTGLSPVIWHIHEMLFGFAATIAVGFILTAVQTWTGCESIKGKPVLGLILLWCLIRGLIWTNTTVTISLAIVGQLIWWVYIIFTYSQLVLKVKNKRNYLFIPLLSSMATINISILLLDINNNTALALHLSRSMVLLFTLLIAIVAGRVIPFFTMNGAKTELISNVPAIEKLLLPISIMGVFIFILGYFIRLPFTPGAILICAGFLHFIRLSQWKTIKTLTIPLLWSLHIAYFFMALGLVLLGGSYFYTNIIFSNALHLITVGGIGLMIIAMISRVSLGHTGRLLQPRIIVSVSFVLMALAALFRALIVYIIPINIAWAISTILWVAAGSIFIYFYWPILSSARVSR